ncbi:MAG: SUMF1/EgtB/PvdO family nonheme iron enzyme [Thermoguttaceae bacterium]|jgi:formylglycine-generating enzyme required for sulfatase activity
MFDKTIAQGWLAAALVASAMSAQASTITIDMVTVGDPGNAADTAANSGNPAGQGVVAYTYQIGKYDVTNNQYAAFLNAKAASSDPYGLWDSIMQTTANGGIDRTGSGSYTYTVKSGQGNQPVVGVTWFDALRFANWLDNGQGSGDTETGSYTLLGGTPTPSNFRTLARNAGAQWVLPSEDEWYKASYYKGGGTNAGYWTYPTRSNTAPTSEAPPGGANSANFYDSTTGYALSGSTTSVSTMDYLTDVGAYCSSLGPYGTYDQGGDVWQWNEADTSVNGSGSSRGMRGGSSNNGSYNLAASSRNGYAPANEDYHVGFRVGYLPEPGSIALLLAGAVALGIWKLRRNA